MSECESCGKVIMREMSFFDGELENSDKDNILCAIQKNEPDELGKPGRHPYYMIRCQRMRLQERINILRAKYPKMIIKRPTCDAANAVICWVEFQNYLVKKVIIVIIFHSTRTVVMYLKILLILICNSKIIFITL